MMSAKIPAGPRLHRTPTTRRGSCAPAESGDVAATPPRNVMNSRRFMSRPSRSRKHVTTSSYVMLRCASQQNWPPTAEMGHSRQGGASCRSSHVRNAPLATVGPKKAACRDGPTTDSRSAANKFHHSITSSARAKSVGGIVNPSALAVLRLMTSSSLMLCWTGRSAGLAPLRIFPV